LKLIQINPKRYCSSRLSPLHFFPGSAHALSPPAHSHYPTVRTRRATRGHRSQAMPAIVEPPALSPASRNQAPLLVLPRPPRVARFPNPHLTPASPRLRSKGAARCHRASVPFPSSVLSLKHPTGQTPLPIAFPSAPTIGEPPLTGNSAAPPPLSPLRGESRYRARSSPLLPFGLSLTSPSILQSRRSGSGQH
jgi:hypothetical protein